MWKSKLGSAFYLTGKTRKYLNKDNQRSRIVFSDSKIKDKDDGTESTTDVLGQSVWRGEQGEPGPQRKQQQQETEVRRDDEFCTDDEECDE